MNINDFMFTLDSLFGMGKTYRLKKVAPWFEYTEESDGKKKKGEQLGYTYTVVETDIVAKFTVKVGGTEPIIENAAIKKSANPIEVTFENTEATFYGERLYDCKLTAIAEKIALVPTNTTKSVKLTANV